MLNIRLYFENNNSWNNKEVDFPYICSFAKTLMWLYSDEADGPRDQYYNIDGEIKLYQLVNVILLLVSHASQELGEATIKEFIHDMEKGQGDRWKTHNNDISEFTNQKGERGMSIMWATYELVMSVLWGGYIYCSVLTRLGVEEKRWQSASDLFYKIMKDESGLKSSAFNNHWLIKHTDEMVATMLSDIERRKEKEGENERKNQVKENNDSFQQQLADAQKTIDEQAKTIEKLQAELEKIRSTLPVNVDMDVDYDDVNKWAKVIFFATVLNAAYQKKFTVGQQLALFISLICGGKPSTYQPIISKIASMEDNEKDKSGESYSPQVIKAAKDIVNRLVEIPEGKDVHPTIQRYIDSICDEFGIEKPKKKER